MEAMAKHMVVLPDSSIAEILLFLDAAEVYGTDIPTEINPLDPGNVRKTVAFEARIFKKMFLKLRE
jgi:tetratricopeptide repeat protein 30